MKWIRLQRMLVFWCLLAGAPLQAQEQLPGELAWGRSLILALHASGIIEHVQVSPGMRVKQGQELLRLDRAVEQARLQAADSRLKESRLQLEEAQRERERVRELYERALAADHDLQLAQIAEQGAHAGYQEARVQRLLAVRQRDDGILHAPWDGRIQALYVQVAQAVLNRDTLMPLLELVQDETMLIQARASAQQRERLPAGTEVTVLVNQQPYTGVVQAWQVEAIAKPSQTYPLTVVITPGPDSGLLAGMPASIVLP